jgi:hypothetical protein
MIICMRTTLVLDDALLKQARRRAAERNVTISDVVNDALREAFGRPMPAARPFSMITYGKGGRRLRHEPADFAAALEGEDLGLLVHQLRYCEFRDMGCPDLDQRVQQSP